MQILITSNRAHDEAPVATFASAAFSTVNILLSEAVTADAALTPSEWPVTATSLGTVAPTAAVLTDADTISLTLPTRIAPGDPVSVSYVRTTKDRLRDSAGQHLRSFDGLSVLNQTPAKPVASLVGVKLQAHEETAPDIIVQVNLDRAPVAGDLPASLGVSFATAPSTSDPAESADLIGGFRTEPVALVAGQASYTVTVTAFDDALVEPAEGILVELVNALGVTLGSTKVFATVLDSDSSPTPPSPSVVAAVAINGAAAGNGTFASTDNLVGAWTLTGGTHTTFSAGFAVNGTAVPGKSITNPASAAPTLSAAEIVALGLTAGDTLSFDVYADNAGGSSTGSASLTYAAVVSGTQTVSSSYSPITAPVSGASTIYRTWNDLPMVVVGGSVVVDAPTPAPVTGESGVWNVTKDGAPTNFTGYIRNQAVLNYGVGADGQGGWVTPKQGIHNAAYPTYTPVPDPFPMGSKGKLGNPSSAITQYDPAKSVAFPYTFSTPGTITFTVSQAPPLPNNPRSITQWMQPLIGLASPPTGPGLPFQRDPSVGTDTAPRFYDNATDIEPTWWTTPSGTAPSAQQPTTAGSSAGTAAALSRALSVIRHPALSQLDSTFREFAPLNQQTGYGGDLNATIAEIDWCCYYNLITEAQQTHWLKLCVDLGFRLTDRRESGGRQRGGVEPINFGGGASWMKWCVIKAAHTARNAANVTARDAVAYQADGSNFTGLDRWAEDMMFFYNDQAVCEIVNTGQGDGINGWVFHFYEGEAQFAINPTPPRLVNVSGLFDGNRTYYGPNFCGLLSQALLAEKMGIFDTYMQHPARERVMWNFVDWLRWMGTNNPSFSWQQYMTPFLAPIIVAEWPTTFPYPTSAPTLLGTYCKGGFSQPDQVWFVFDHLLTFDTMPTAADFVVKVDGVTKTPVAPTLLSELNGGGGTDGRRLPNWGTGPFFKHGSRMGVFLPAGTISAGSTVTLQYTSNPARPARTVAFTAVGNVAQQTATNLIGGGTVA